MIQKIRGFANDVGIGLRHACERQFQSFLADFLRDSPSAFGQQVRGVAAGGPIVDTLGDDAFQLPKNANCSAAARGGVSPKQVRVPRWQAGPSGFARISSVSPSQSAAMARTSRKLPGGLALGPQAVACCGSRK